MAKFKTTLTVTVEAEMFDNSKEGNKKIQKLLDVKKLDINENGKLSINFEKDENSKSEQDNLVLVSGDWLIKDEEGVFSMMSSTEFDTVFQVVN